MPLWIHLARPLSWVLVCWDSQAYVGSLRSLQIYSGMLCLLIWWQDTLWAATGYKRWALAAGPWQLSMWKPCSWDLLLCLTRFSTFKTCSFLSTAAFFWRLVSTFATAFAYISSNYRLSYREYTRLIFILARSRASLSFKVYARTLCSWCIFDISTHPCTIARQFLHELSHASLANFCLIEKSTVIHSA